MFGFFFTILFLLHLAIGAGIFRVVRDGRWEDEPKLDEETGEPLQEIDNGDDLKRMWHDDPLELILMIVFFHLAWPLVLYILRDPND